MRVCLMIEGQEGVEWRHWVALASACDRHEFDALFRSDHYLSARGQSDLASLDAWATLAGLAARTERVRLGTLVSPATFRHPAVVAKMATTVDHISGGRVEVGLGAGWFEDEHRAFGFPFPSDADRLSLLEEQLEIVIGLWSGERFSFSGAHYRLEPVEPRPLPVQRPRPRLIVGGSRGSRSIELAARWADEYNTLLASLEDCRRARARLEAAYERAGRDPSTVRLSLMVPLLIGGDENELRARAERLARFRGRHEDPTDLLTRARAEWVAGTPTEVVDRLGELAEAGVDRVMLQHLLHDDVEAVELVGRLVPGVQGP